MANHSAHTLRTILLCLIGAVLEGIDLQSAAVAAPRMAPALLLDKQSLGWVFSASTTGLMIGAVLGGYGADRIGRKRVLLISMLCFGVFSLGTALVETLQPMLWMRLLTGIGMGGAMPNLIALASENSPDATRGRWVALMYAGIPLGGALASWITMLRPDDWRTVFVVGGLLPLLLTPLMAVAMPESQRFLSLRAVAPQTPAQDVMSALFGPGRAFSTLLLWLAASLTLLVIYSVYNWLPTLLLGRGFTGKQVSTVQLALSLGGVIGTLMMGVLMDSRWRTLFLAMIYALATVLLAMLARAPADLAPTLALGFMVGVALQGTTALLFVIAPVCYETAHRSIGVGASVAAGRIGAIAGPVIVGMLISHGMGVDGVLLSMTPITLATLVCAALLSHRAEQLGRALR